MMRLKIFIPLVVLFYLSSCSPARIVTTRPSVKCMENSPERRGQEGCSILANRPLVGSSTNNVFWHIDRFDSLEAARKVAGPNSVATTAHGSFWLLTVETKMEDCSLGGHVTQLGPLALPPIDQYLMRVLSSRLEPGSTTPIHTHSGPEVFFIVDGEQCIERQGTSQHLSSGQSYIVPGSTIHRGRVIGSKARQALALILYDASFPGSKDLDNATVMTSCE